MLVVVLAMLTAGPVQAQFPPLESTPEINAPVTDEVGVLIDPDGLSRRLRTYHAEHSLQMAVLIIRTTGGEPIEDYALRVATRWGGGSVERDDGVLFVLAIDDRRMRLEVGYGLEAEITDARAAQLLEQAKPFLRSQDYDGAVDVVVDGISTLHEGGQLKPVRGMRSAGVTKVLFYGLASLLGLIAGVLFARRRRKREEQAFLAEVEEAEPPPEPPRDVWTGWLVLPLAAVLAAVVWGGSADPVLLAVYGIFFVTGWATDAAADHEIGWQAVFWFALVAIYFVGLWVVADEGLHAHLLVVAVMHVSAGAIATAALWVIVNSPGGGGGSSYSSSSWSSSSSSFSSGGFSGGGGSFGGGGASGSW